MLYYEENSNIKLVVMNQTERIAKMDQFDANTFLLESIDLLDQSKKDPEVILSDHRQLFDLFVKKADELFPGPLHIKATLIKRTAWMQYLKK